MSGRVSILIVDDSRPLRESIRSMLDLEPEFVVVGEADTGARAVELASSLHPDVVLMDINMPGMDGITAAGRIVAEVPGTEVIMVSVEGNPDYFRRAMQAGARDYLVKPFTCDDLVNAIRQARRHAPAGTAGSVATGQRKRGRLITLFSSKGGVGKTTLAANLATALARKTRGRTLLVDLDLELGNLGVLLGVKPHHTIVDLCRREGTLTEEQIEKVLVPVGESQAYLLAAPLTPDLAAEVDGDGRKDRDRNYVGEILTLVQEHWDYIVADTGAGFRDATMVALEMASLVLMVTTPDIPTLSNAAKGLDILLDRLEYSRDKVRLVLNRCDGLFGLTLEDIERGLQTRISFYLPSDGILVARAANCGQPFVAGRVKSPLVDAVNKLADWVVNPESTAPGSPVPAKPKRRGLFGLPARTGEGRV